MVTVRKIFKPYAYKLDGKSIKKKYQTENLFTQPQGTFSVEILFYRTYVCNVVVHNMLTCANNVDTSIYF